MKKRFISLLFIVFILLIGTLGFNKLVFAKQQQSVEASLIQSMESTHADVLESTISTWGKINEEFMTDQQIEKEINALIEIIKPDETTIQITKEKGEELNKSTITARSGNKYYVIVVESVKASSGGESYVIIDASMDEDSSQLASERKKLEEYFSVQKSKPNISSCIVGTYNGKLAVEDMKQKIAEAMNIVNAKQVEGIANEEVNSISAFSGNINNFVLSNNKKVNMQIAMRYSSYDDKTYIWIGSPLIHVEY